MAFRLFSIAIPNDGTVEEELNRFLAGHRIVALQSQWATRGDVPYLVFTVEYVPGKAEQAGLASPPSRFATAAVDYRELLPPEAFARFSKLRDWRRKTAEAEGVKAFVIFTNAQLAAIAQMENPDLAALRKVDGLGEARAAKYGEGLLATLSEEMPEGAKEGSPAATEAAAPAPPTGEAAP